MADKKRTVQGGYEVIHAVELGGSELILAEKKGDPDAPYMVSDCVWNRDLCYESHHNAMGSTDFLEIMKLFAHRLSERVIAIETERETRDIPFQTLTAADCNPVGKTDLEGCVVVLRPDILSHEYRTIDYQLALCTGGFGSKPDSSGRTVFCKNLITGETVKYRRSDIAGTLPEDRLPEWARINLEALQPSVVKETEAIAAVKPLDTEQFWQLIDTARETAGGWHNICGPLMNTLSRLEEPDIIRFKLIFDEYQSLSHKDKLWAAASVMLKGCSDDSFDYFRGWLTAQGKEVFMNALADPDSLSDVEAVKVSAREVLDHSYFTFSDEYQEAARLEEMLYVAGSAYTQKLGRDADIYDVIDKHSLSETEKREMAREIVYAEDIDAKWFNWGEDEKRIDSKLQKLVPKLYGMFDYSDNKECDRIDGELKLPTRRDSVLEKIKQAQQGKQQPDKPKPKNKKQNKSDPEL